MIVLGKEAAKKILRHLDEDEIAEIARAAATLGIVDRGAIEQMIDEFAADFEEGPDVVGNAAQAQELVAEALGPQEAERIISGPAPSPPLDVWRDLTGRPREQIVSMLEPEPPWIVAAVLANLAPELASDILPRLEESLRRLSVAVVLSRPAPTAEAQRLMEAAVHTVAAGSGAAVDADESPRRIADIMNRMSGELVDDVMNYLSTVAPGDAARVRSLIFKFEELTSLSQRDRAAVFDTLPTEKVILALKGAQPEIVEAALAALGARARRMVEAELANDARTPERETEAARRLVVETVLRLAASGEIARPAPVSEP